MAKYILTLLAVIGSLSGCAANNLTPEERAQFFSAYMQAQHPYVLPAPTQLSVPQVQTSTCYPEGQGVYSCHGDQ